MDLAAGSGAGAYNTGGHGWWAVDISPSQASTEDGAIVSEKFIQEYTVLAAVAATMSCGFLLLNQKGQVAYFNASAVRLLDVSSQELIEQPGFDIREQLLARAVEPERARDELNYIWEHPERETAAELALMDGTTRWLRLRSFPIHDKPGSLLGRGILLDDITLERASIESRSEALALAAHELKTPLAIIKGAATTLLANSLRWDAGMQREMLQMIDTQADRLYDILNTLLDVWRLDSGAASLQFTPLHIAELLRQLVERWQKQQSDHFFVLHMPAGTPIIVCDAARTEQAFDALLSNAVTYSPAGKTITIRLEHSESEVRVSISDEGIGIAPELLERIFDRFYRVQRGDEHAGGRGLGLSVARAIVEAHGGKIWADSAGAGLGSTFYITLPYTPQLPIEAQSQAQAVAAPQAGAPARPTGVLKQSERSYILVAEGDVRLARYLRANLEEQHYRVLAVNQGAQFLRQLQLEEPDVILLSTFLPDMNGLELLQRLREFSRTPVVMLSDECEEDERVRLLDLGADDVVIKPFGMNELLARVRALLRRGASSMEQPPGQAVFTTGELVIDYAQHQVFVGDRQVPLSRTEYRLLSTLARNAGKVLTHEVLLERVWGPEYNREVDFIWVYISRLRHKIEDDPRRPRYILTIPDVGYKLAKL